MTASLASALLHILKFETITKCLLFCVVLLFSISSSTAFAFSTPNIPLDSPFYGYIEKLAAFDLIESDFKGLRPYSKSEASRLLEEAKRNSEKSSDLNSSSFINSLIHELESYAIHENIPHDSAIKLSFFDWTPLASAKLRYVYLDGVPRNYNRQVHDPGGDGVFGIGAGLRPNYHYPNPVSQHGTEGTPLLENNEGNVYRRGGNLEVSFTTESYAGSHFAALLEPMLTINEDAVSSSLGLNKGYLKVGGGAVELEFGRDSVWLGPGYRGAVTLTNNAKNLDLIKLSSPEPLDLGSWGKFKYLITGSRFDRTITDGVERQPWFYAIKLAYKPTGHFEIGFNLGRQVGGPGVKNGLGATISGLVGGISSDNSNSLAGVDFRYRASWLRNTEFYGEFSGEDRAGFWPIVESYVAGVYIPRLTSGGLDDFRFEYFQGNQILYSSGTFPGGYLYSGMPVGHSQGGATQELFFRYSHWFSPQDTVALEYFNTKRGVVGKMPGQVEENKDSFRGVWRLPVGNGWNAEMIYGWEHIDNINLVEGAKRSNQVVKLDFNYKY